MSRGCKTVRPETREEDPNLVLGDLERFLKEVMYMEGPGRPE